MRIAIRSLGELMITAGVLLLLFLVWQLWWTDIEANAEADNILESTRDTFASGASGASDPPRESDRSGRSSGDLAGAGDPPANGLAAAAIVHMPTIGEVRPVLAGVELSVLNQGVLGQYPDSEAPGEVGSFTLAGHRTTYGRPLWSIAELQAGDPIVVETAETYYVYRFDRNQVVTPFQTEVIADVPGDSAAEATQKWMVMTACHPKFSAAERIVAFNSFSYQQPRSQGPPAEIAG
ncbi:MAG: class E sortase [Ornithinimicrobium sp.]